MAETTNQATSFPKVGRKAPAFSAPGSNGNQVKLSDFTGKVVVLYFYPKDNTPGCTVEACGFRDAHNRLKKAGVEVLGVSPDSLKSHADFSEKFGLPFVLLADEKQEICKKYGVWRQKTMAGRKYMGVVRTTFVIDREGKIAHVFEKVKPEGHEDEVLAWIEEHL